MRNLLVLTLCLFLVGTAYLVAQAYPTQTEQHKQHDQSKQTDQTQTAPGTRDQGREIPDGGRIMTPEGAVFPDTGLPATASPLPLIGLIGFLSLGGAAALRTYLK